MKDHIAQIESGGKYDAVNGHAYGKYQMMPTTYKDIAAKLGTTVAYLKTPEGQEKAMDYLLTEQTNKLQQLGQDISNENVYVLHQLGMTRGERYFRNQLTNKDYTLMWKNLPKSEQEKIDRTDHKAIKKAWDARYRRVR